MQYSLKTFTLSSAYLSRASKYEMKNLQSLDRIHSQSSTVQAGFPYESPFIRKSLSVTIDQELRPLSRTLFIPAVMSQAKDANNAGCNSSCLNSKSHDKVRGWCNTTVVGEKIVESVCVCDAECKFFFIILLVCQS